MNKLAKALLRVIGVVGQHQQRLDEVERRLTALEAKPHDWQDSHIHTICSRCRMAFPDDGPCHG